ncbi:hypothetical protein UFOVP591_45 [uncultured Caudovirales phage]|uniref:Uncharacterized protein n=1 Tax=uncultured Caudovirales phage TaxID=2100421 RepID=A0A6J5N8F3_9CAUD|nr:hypothetical protein UFOVP591_45 [uncultured Caudovirales phage]
MGTFEITKVRDFFELGRGAYKIAEKLKIKSVHSVEQWPLRGIPKSYWDAVCEHYPFMTIETCFRISEIARKEYRKRLEAR